MTMFIMESSQEMQFRVKEDIPQIEMNKVIR